MEPRTFDQGRREAIAQMASLCSEIEASAAPLVRQLGLTEAQAFTRVLKAYPSFRRRYAELRSPNAWAKRFSAETAEQETMRIVDEMRDLTASPLKRTLDALATEYALKHDLTHEEAFSHILRQHPDLQEQWIAEIEGRDSRKVQAA